MQLIRTGDKVQIIRGEGRPRTAEARKQPSGTVLSVDREGGTCIVDGCNMVWKHKKAKGENEPGGREQRAASIHLSNVMLFNEEAGRAERVGTKMVNGKRVRCFRKSGKVVEQA